MNKKLTQRQEKFIHEYLISGNATQAAVKAGYAEKTAYAMGHENLRKPKIITKISHQQSKTLNRLAVTEERIIQEIASVAFFNMKDLFHNNGTLKDLSEISAEGLKAVNSLETIELDNKKTDEKIGKVKKIRLHDKLKALEMLGRNLKMFTDKVEHSVDEDLAKIILKARKRVKGVE